MGYAFIIVSIFLIAACVGLFFSVRMNLTFIEQRDDLVEQIDESLDIIDDCYASFSRAADTPVLSDDATVRNLVGEIKRLRHAALLVANKIKAGFDTNNDRAPQPDR